MASASEETTIHPTAVVDPSAEIGNGVHIGPYCVIHAGGVQIGDGTTLQNHVTIAGPAKIGSHNRFYAYASVGQQTQDLKYAGEPTWLEIGDTDVDPILYNQAIGELRNASSLTQLLRVVRPTS